MSERVRVTVNGESYEVTVLSRKREAITFELQGRNYEVSFEDSVETRKNTSLPRKNAKSPAIAPTIEKTPSIGQGSFVLAPIPGIVLEVLVKEGQRVEAGEILLRIEAMKMENNIFSPRAGVVAKIVVDVGSEVRDSQELLEITS